MGAAPGVVHWMEHSAHPQVVLDCFQHQQAAIEDHLKRPGVEARECEGHGADVLGLVTPSPELAEPLLMDLNGTCDLGHARSPLVAQTFEDQQSQIRTRTEFVNVEKSLPIVLQSRSFRLMMRGPRRDAGLEAGPSDARRELRFDFGFG